MSITVASTPTDPVAIKQAAICEAERLSHRIVIGGSLQNAKTVERFAVENPADGSVIAHCPRCASEDVAWAVENAHRAFAEWRGVPARERGALVAQAAAEIQAQGESIACLTSLETGNALATQTRPEVGLAVDMLQYFAGLAGELKGRTVPSDANTLSFTTCDPLGVVGAIIPWNAPLLLMAAKLGPALVAGNTVVLKSAEQAPLAVLRCAELMQAALPPGVLNVIAGFGEEAGKPLAEHRLVRKVTFTGSCPVGKQILHYVADKVVPVTLELGGKSPNIVLPDADLDKVVPGIVQGMRFTRQGQSCTAGSRLFLHDDIYDEVMERTVEAVVRLRLGDPLNESTHIGTIVSREQFDRVRSFVELAKRTPGVRIRCGGGPPDDPALRGGLYFRPTLIEGLPLDSPVCREEIFGPVAVVIPWNDFDRMIEHANDSEFGLAATLWTRDLHRAMQFITRIEAGFVQVNQYGTPRANVAYGGMKQSGLGKEYSLESMITHFTESKTVVINYDQ